MRTKEKEIQEKKNQITKEEKKYRYRYEQQHRDKQRQKGINSKETIGQTNAQVPPGESPPSSLRDSHARLRISPSRSRQCCQAVMTRRWHSTLPGDLASLILQRTMRSSGPVRGRLGSSPSFSARLPLVSLPIEGKYNAFFFYVLNFGSSLFFVLFFSFYLWFWFCVLFFQVLLSFPLRPRHIHQRFLFILFFLLLSFTIIIIHIYFLTSTYLFIFAFPSVLFFYHIIIFFSRRKYPFDIRLRRGAPDPPRPLHQRPSAANI